MIPINTSFLKLLLSTNNKFMYCTHIDSKQLQEEKNGQLHVLKRKYV